MNHIFICGRLTADPRRLGKGDNSPVLFSVAVNRPGKDSGCDFFSVKAWDKLGELVLEHLTKGKTVTVSGPMYFTEYKDKDGNPQRGHEIMARDIRFM